MKISAFVPVLAVTLLLLGAIGNAAGLDPQSGPAIAADSGFSAVPGSIKPTTDVDMGEFSSPKMTVDVVLAPRNEPELSGLLANVYNPKSDSYRHWLGKGEFYSRFAPSDAQIAAIASHLQASG